MKKILALFNSPIRNRVMAVIEKKIKQAEQSLANAIKAIDDEAEQSLANAIKAIDDEAEKKKKHAEDVIVDELTSFLK